MPTPSRATSHLSLRRGRATAGGGLAAVLLLALALVLPAGEARADEYESGRAGHPLRIAAYILHPIGVVLEYSIFRPAHWIVHWEPAAEFFGHRED
jgi:hypothetical protein